MSGSITGMNIPTPPEWVRAWYYRLITPVTAIVLYYGWTDSQTWALWTGVVLGLLGGTQAAVNTSTSRQPATDGTAEPVEWAAAADEAPPTGQPAE